MFSILSDDLTLLMHECPLRGSSITCLENMLFSFINRSFFVDQDLCFLCKHISLEMALWSAWVRVLYFGYFLPLVSIDVIDIPRCFMLFLRTIAITLETTLYLTQESPIFLKEYLFLLFKMSSFFRDHTLDPGQYRTLFITI